MNRDPRGRGCQADGTARPVDLNREADARAREIVVSAWRRALLRMRERRAARGCGNPGG